MISVTVRPNFERYPPELCHRAAAARRQLDAEADLRPHADLLGILEDQAELGVLLDDRDDVAPDLLGQHRHLDELGVLEAVADDRDVVGGQCRHRHQLRLAARLDAEVVGTPELQDFLDHLALLVDLDRVHARVLARVRVLLDRSLEGAGDVAQAMLQDVGKAHQDRQRDAAHLQAIHQLLEVDRPLALLGRVHEHVPVLANREVAVAPAVDVVQLGRIDGRPGVGGAGARQGAGRDRGHRNIIAAFAARAARGFGARAAFTDACGTGPRARRRRRCAFRRAHSPTRPPRGPGAARRSAPAGVRWPGCR